jgi:hypothetical protein
MAFVGNWGVRGDIRYFRAFARNDTTTSTTGTTSTSTSTTGTSVSTTSSGAVQVCYRPRLVARQYRSRVPLVTARQCRTGFAWSSRGCPAFDRLLGSRMLVGNLEFRFPLLRPFGAASRMYGPVPIEVALFADGGVAWNRGETPALFGGSRQGVSSAGLALRANLFGYAVGQLDFSRPFQRRGSGWVVQFNLSPGF